MIDPNYQHNTACIQLDAVEAELIILALECGSFSPHLVPLAEGIIKGLTEFFTTEDRPVDRKIELENYWVEGTITIESEYEDEDY